MVERIRSFVRGDSERGAAAVEMAITTIFLFLLVAGIVDLGRALYANIGVQEAAQEGAIFGSFSVEGTLDGGEQTTIENRVLDAVDFPPPGELTVTIGCDSSTDPDTIEVTVDHDVDLITPIVGDFFGGTITLSRTVSGQMFQGTCP